MQIVKFFFLFLTICRAIVLTPVPFDIAPLFSLLGNKLKIIAKESVRTKNSLLGFWTDSYISLNYICLQCLQAI